MAPAGHGAPTTHLSGFPQKGRLRRLGNVGMAAERDRSWRVMGDLACIGAGGVLIFCIASWVNLVPRLLGGSASGNPAALRRAVLLLATLTIALALFGWLRWREVRRTRAAVAGWAHRDPITGLPDRTVAQV